MAGDDQNFGSMRGRLPNVSSRRSGARSPSPDARDSDRPQPALVIRRADLAREETVARLVAEMRRKPEVFLANSDRTKCPGLDSAIRAGVSCASHLPRGRL